MHPAQLDQDELLRQCQVRRQRRSGPGGQHRNKVETGIFLEHLPTACRAEATEKRSQHANLQVALFRLRLRLAVQIRSPEPPQAPSPLWMSRLRGEKISVSPSHHDFPALLAEAIDFLMHAAWDSRTAAQQMHCSHSQFVKLLKAEPSALRDVNQRRASFGLPPLR